MFLVFEQLALTMGDADKFPIIRDKGRYRIQSVDFETFLERRGADILLRPLKKTSTNQEVSDQGRIVLLNPHDTQKRTQ